MREEADIVFPELARKSVDVLSDRLGIDQTFAIKHIKPFEAFTESISMNWWVNRA